MKQLLGFLIVSLLADVWLSLKVVQCQNLPSGINTTSFCYNRSSGKTCFTTFIIAKYHRAVLKPFQTASRWCKVNVPGSSLVIINSIESHGIFERLIGREVLMNETIITDARKVSARESLKWSWVNGHPTGQKNISRKAKEFHDGACVEKKDGKRLIYCSGNIKSQFRYICEYSDSKSEFSYQQNNKSYVASEANATWYDARKECLQLGGDLASITNLRTMDNWSTLTEKNRYWIGLHRNKWIWKSTGAAVSYTNWKTGYPDESSDKQCICVSPQCKEENRQCKKEFNRKWRACNCNNSYAIVCQKEEKSDALTTKIVATEEMLTFRRKTATRTPPPAIVITPSFKTPIVTSPAKTTTIATATSSKTPTTIVTTQPSKLVIPTVTIYTTTTADNTVEEIDGRKVSTSSVTQKRSTDFVENQTTTLASSSTSPSTGLFKLFNTQRIFVVLPLLVAVVVTVVAFILIIRKCKYDRRNDGSAITNRKQSERVSSVYEPVGTGNRPSYGAVPFGNTLYSDVETTQRRTPFNDTIYATVQQTSETVDMGENVVYTDLDFPKKDQQKPRSADKIIACLNSSIYSQFYKPPTHVSH